MVSQQGRIYETELKAQMSSDKEKVWQILKIKIFHETGDSISKAKTNYILIYLKYIN